MDGYILVKSPYIEFGWGDKGFYHKGNFRTGIFNGSPNTNSEVAKH